MALDPDLIDHWLIWICLWDEFVRHASVPFVAVCITLCRLLSVPCCLYEEHTGNGVLVNRHQSIIGVLFWGVILGCCYTRPEREICC